MNNLDVIFGKKEEESDLYRCVGFIVIQFSHVEQCLDLMVAAIYQNTHKTKRPKKIPKMLDIKLKYLTSSAESEIRLKVCRDEIIDLVAQVRDINGFRNDLIHGAIASTISNDGTYEFLKLDLYEGYHNVSEVVFDLKKVPEMARRLLDIGRLANVVSRKTIDALCT